MIVRPAHGSPPLPGWLPGLAPLAAPRRYHRPMRIRLADLSDAEAIRTIYNVEVLDSTNTFDMVPRSPAEQEAWILRHSGVHPAVVAVDEPDPGSRGPVGGNGEIVLGFGSLSTFRDALGILGHRRGLGLRRPLPARPGVGRAVLAELLTLATAHGFHSVIARIAGHNEPSIGLHQAAGFELVGVEREVGPQAPPVARRRRAPASPLIGEPTPSLGRSGLERRLAAAGHQRRQARRRRSATTPSSCRAGRWPRPTGP